MAKIKLLNPETGKKEWVDSKGTLERAGKSTTDRFATTYGSGDRPDKTGASSIPSNQKYKIDGLEFNSLEEAQAFQTKNAGNPYMGQIEQSTSDIRKEGEKNKNKLNEINQNTQSNNENNATGSTDMTGSKDTGTDETSVGLSSNFDNYQSQIQSLINERLKLNAQYDATSNSMIQNIKNTFTNRINEMKETNRKQLQYETQVGMRDTVGRSRYAPKMQQQILTNEEQKGMMRISDLETQMYELVIKAEQAKTEEDIKSLNDTMKMYGELYKEQQSNILNLYKISKETENARADAAKAQLDFDIKTSEKLAPFVKDALDQLPTQAEKEEFIAKYASKMGISEPAYIYSALKEYGIDLEKDQLDIQSKKTSIYNSTRSNQRADDKANEYITDVENIISGATKLSDVSSSNKTKVVAELREYGFYQERAPQWFVDMQEAELGMNLDEDTISEEWITFKTDRGL